MRKNERKISRESRVRSNSSTFSRLNNAMCQEGCRAFNDDRQVRPPRFGGRADCANISRDPVLRMRRALRETRRRLHDTRHPCDGGDDDHCAMRGGTHPRGPRARLPQRGAAPQGARRPVSGHVEWRAPRALRPPARDDRERVGDPDRGSPRWSAPPRGPYRDVRGGGANELHRVPRAVLRELDGRENRTGAVPHPCFTRRKPRRRRACSSEAGLRVHPQLLQPVSDRRHALATLSRRGGASARSTRPRVFEIARTTLSRRVVFFVFFTKTRLTRRLRCPFSTHADATTT